MRTLYLVSVWLHIVAVAAWLGGMLFLVFVLVPLVRHPSTREHAAPLFHAIGVKFRLVGWIALGTLVVTGIVNLGFRGFGLADLFSGRAFVGEWGDTLAKKLALVTIVLVSGVVHDFFIGPTAVKLASDDRASTACRERYRRAASWMGRMTLVFALAIVALAIRLVR
jgi:copper resistance protein D